MRELFGGPVALYLGDFLEVYGKSGWYRDRTGQSLG